MIKIRGARGLGDAFYIYPVVKYFIDKGEAVEVMTNYPEVYETLNCKTISRAGNPDINLSYATRYGEKSTTIYQDTLIMGGLEKENIPFVADYKWRENSEFPTNKKICVIKSPGYAMGRKDRDTACLIPDLKVYQEIINSFKNKCYFVLSGLKNDFNFNLEGIDEDLTHIDVIPRLASLIDRADIVLTQSSHFMAIAQMLNTKCFVVFNHEGLKTNIKFYRHITPAKAISNKEMSGHAIDDEPINKILAKFERLLDK